MCDISEIPFQVFQLGALDIQVQSVLFATNALRQVPQGSLWLSPYPKDILQ